MIRVKQKFRLGILVVCTLIGTMNAVFAQEPKAKLDSGDTAWMLMATALVLMMTVPGLVLFYGGMVRKKNVLST
ncbi:MAG: ammonia channel protein, partial [Alphaproteobacteria bacterium]